MYLCLCFICIHIDFVSTCMCIIFDRSLSNSSTIGTDIIYVLGIGVWGGGGGGLGGSPPPPRIFQIAIFGQNKNHVIFGENHLIFGQTIRATDLSPPKRNWSRTPMLLGIYCDNQSLCKACSLWKHTTTISAYYCKLAKKKYCFHI